MRNNIYSFIVDNHPRFSYEGWHLARSLQLHCAAPPRDIHVQFTPEVTADIEAIFADAGYSTHRIEPFGDGKWCNKLAQIPNVLQEDFDYLLLLDTDTITVGDMRPFFTEEALYAKVVDFANPSLQALTEIFDTAGVQKPELILTDAGDGKTFSGNCNGGMYALHKSVANTFSEKWRQWALWLMNHSEPLRRENKVMHIDQIAAALAIYDAGIPFRLAPANVNYFTHQPSPHICHDESQPIALLHYHDTSINVLGLLASPPRLPPAAASALAEANRIISGGFHNTLFWQFRYAMFPERGSGVGSRGAAAEFKRSILKAQGVESAKSILDVGCGDFEVLAPLNLNGYLGIDTSEQAISIAKSKRPDLNFELFLGQEIAPRDMVICLEVLIHQTTPEAYRQLVDFLVAHTGDTLIVSGYNAKTPHHMCYFHEPLQQTLQNTGAFSAIREIGRHSDVVMYACTKAA